MNSPLEIRTERLLLRPFTMDDVEDVHKYKSDPEGSPYGVYESPPPFTRKVAEELVAMFSNPPDSQGILQVFAVVLQVKVIGEIGLNQHYEDHQNDRVEIVYSLSRQHWNKGLTTEAARAVMDWAFHTYAINRMYAWSDPRNIGSWRVLENLGMKYEGQLRSHTKWNGTFRDRVYYGILRDERKTNSPDTQDSEVL
ncbi:GNAT family N-acetyltransferase [Chloroflexota bacterium]